MTAFLETALTFPTLVYSILLAVCVAYWLISATGLVSGDSAEAWIGVEGEPGELSGAGAMLARVGLGGIPIMVVLTTLSFIAWFGTYFAHLLWLRHLPDPLRAAAGAGTMVAMAVPAVAATSLLLRPVRGILARLQHRAAEPALLGRTGTVVTPTLTPTHGQAAVDDGGAGLILQIRHDGPERLTRGDRVVLIEYIDEQHAYRVVPEHQFLARSAPTPTPHERLAK